MAFSGEGSGEEASGTGMKTVGVKLTGVGVGDGVGGGDGVPTGVGVGDEVPGVGDGAPFHSKPFPIRSILLYEKEVEFEFTR